MCTCWGHICIITLNIKFLSLIQWLRGLRTDAESDVVNADVDTDNDKYAQWTNHDYIGSFRIIPNEPKSPTMCKYLSKCIVYTIFYNLL